jgi:hypothetical protein
VCDFFSKASVEMTSVQGYINMGECPEVCYFLDKEELSETQTEYSGPVGYGDICTGSNCEYRDIISNLETEEVEEQHPENSRYHMADSKEFSCIFDSATNRVTITCFYRFEYNTDVHPEDHAFTMVFEDPEEAEKMDGYTYPYIRFPRTKDGVSISRICREMFTTNPVIYFPKRKPTS